MAEAAVCAVVAAWSTSVSSRHASCRAAAGPLLQGATPVEFAEIATWQTFCGGAANVEALDKALATRSYLVGNRLTLADLVAYLACAEAVAASDSTAAKRWLAQVQRETRDLAPSATLPPLVDLKFPLNVAGPLPLPKKKKKNDSKKTPSATASSSSSDPAAAAAASNDDKSNADDAGKKKEKKKKSVKEPAEAEDAASIFGVMDVRVGLIVDAWAHESAEKLYCEKIDVGEEQPRTIASGLRAFYDVTDIKGRKVLVFANLKARTMSGFKSEGMVLCASSDDHATVKFLDPPADAVPGTRVALEGLDNKDAATASQVQKKKLLEKLLPSLRTNADGLACCDGKVFTLPQGPVSAPLPAAAIG